MIQTGKSKLSQSALAVADGYFSLYAETTPDFIEILDTQGRRLFLNHSYVALFTSPENMLGTRPYDDKNLVDGSWMRDMVADVLRDGKTANMQIERIMPDGSHRVFECRVSPIPVTSGSDCESGVLMISSDITDRIQISELLRGYETRIRIAEEIGMIGSWEYDFRTQSMVISERFARIYGLPAETFQLSKEQMFECIHPDDRDRLANMRHEFLPGDSIYDTQYKIVRSDKSVRVIHSRWKLERDHLNQPYRTIGFCDDITEKLSAERKAFTIEEHFQLLVENAEDFAIFLLDTEGLVISWNLGAERVLGYRAEEILGRHYSCFYPAEYGGKTSYAEQLVTVTNTGKYEAMSWKARKGGDTFWAHAIITRVLDKSGNQVGYLKIIHDMTKQKCAEDLLRSQAERLKVNARRLVELQETERQHLARELHDQVGPNLTALGINLQMISSGLVQGEKDKLADILKDSVNYVHATVDVLRYIIGELRPHALDDFGLRAALRTHVTQFMKLTGIKVNIDETDSHEKIPDLIKMSLFRITQEALNNIAKHSHASVVDISIDHAPQKIGLSIKDNGIGFDKDRIETDKPLQSVGLVIIQERAEAIGASFNLETAAGQGVHIYVECNI